MIYGKDVASFIIWSEYDCNIDGGNGYVIFGVNDWILYGGLVHFSLWGLMACWVFCGGCLSEYQNGCVDSDYYIATGPICMICGWCFHISWMVIGLLLYAEMIGDEDISNECKDIVLSWSVLQVIETSCILCIAILFFCA